MKTSVGMMLTVDGNWQQYCMTIHENWHPDFADTAWQDASRSKKGSWHTIFRKSWSGQALAQVTIRAQESKQ